MQQPERARPTKTRLRHSNGVPTLANPTLSLATLGPVPVGVPNFFINKFRIPPFLLSIYQAAGIQYGVRWEVLAAINEIETDYGRNLNVSSAGAMGWMQFIPSSWKSYGVDANADGKIDPYNPADAIFAAARYLKAAGADQDLRKAIFAYNHADWYVDSVLMRARFIGGMPSDLIGSLSGLTQGLFPVHAAAKYADDISEREATKRVARGKNAALPVESSSTRRGINIFAKAGSPAVAVQDGKIVKVGRHQAPRQLRAAAGRLRQHLHLRGPEEGRLEGAGAEGQVAEQGVDRQGARPAEGRGGARRRPPAPARTTPRQGQERAEGDDAGRRPRRPRSPRSACSPTRRAPTRSTPAASSRSSSPSPRWPTARASSPTSPASTASTVTTSSSRASSPAAASSRARSSAGSARPR